MSSQYCDISELILNPEIDNFSLIQSEGNFSNASIFQFIKLYEMYNELGFENEVILEIGRDIIKECFSQSKTDINISKTGDNELLIYRKTQGGFANILIDENADIEYLFINSNRQDSFNEYYSFIDINVYNLVSKM